VSALAWALTIHLPRLSGGIAWLLAIGIWLVGWSDGASIITAVNAGSASPFIHGLVVMLCPFVLIGKRLSGGDLLLAIPAIGLALVMTGIAVISIVRMDAPLESAQ
jgi:hypothetical protein